MRVSGSTVTRQHILEIINMTNEVLLSKEYTENTTQDIIRTANLILNSADNKIVCDKATFLFILLIEELEENHVLQSLITELKLKEKRFIGMNIEADYLSAYNDNINKRRLIPAFEGEFTFPPEGLYGTVQSSELDSYGDRYKITEYIIDSKGYIIDETVSYKEIGLEKAYRKPDSNYTKVKDEVK